MTGFDAYQLYSAVKLHFTRPAYDFHKYNGKSSLSLNNFENRKDKYHFYKLSRRYSDRETMISFLVSNFVELDKPWIGTLLLNEAEENYFKRTKVLQSLAYTFENDCKNVFEDVDNPNDVLKTDGDYPILLKRSLHKDIQIETICILDKLLNFTKMWNKKIIDSIRWPDYSLKIDKYASFIPFNSVKYKLLLKKILNR